MSTNFSKILIKLSQNWQKTKKKALIFSAKLVTDLVILFNVKKLAFEPLPFFLSNDFFTIILSLTCEIFFKKVEWSYFNEII